VKGPKAMLSIESQLLFFHTGLYDPFQNSNFQFLSSAFCQEASGGFRGGGTTPPPGKEVKKGKKVKREKGGEGKIERKRREMQ